VIAATGAWARAGKERSLCDGDHKKPFLIVELLTAPALSGISSDLMQSQQAWTTAGAGRSASALMHRSRDDGSEKETYHEGTHRSSRVGHAYCRPDICSTRERGSGVSGELLIRL
jgi:hypothetical protein